MQHFHLQVVVPEELDFLSVAHVVAVSILVEVFVRALKFMLLIFHIFFNHFCMQCQS